MAEESSGKSWWTTWGGGLIENMKTKSAEAMSFVKNDLTEFVNVIQHDTTEIVADTANTVKDKIKVEQEEAGSTAVIRKGMSSWLDQLSSSLKQNITQIEPTVTEDQPVLDEPLFDRMQARLHEIQTNPGTYCNEPDGPPSLYERWCEDFNLESHKGDISELLVNKCEIRSLYTKLVPGAVTHSLFWNRYFYKLHQLEKEEKRRAALVMRADSAQEDLPGWGDEEDDPWDSDDVGNTGTTEKEIVEGTMLAKKSSGKSQAVLDKTTLESTDPQQLQIVDSLNRVKFDEVNKEQISETITTSDDLQSSDFKQDVKPLESQQKHSAVIPDEGNTVSLTKSVNKTEICGSKFTGSEQNTEHNTTKMEIEHSACKTLSNEEMSGQVEKRNKEESTHGNESENVDKNNDKINSDDTTGVECNALTHTEESCDQPCDQFPPSTLRSNSSDDSVDSSWSKLSYEANGKGVCVEKLSPSPSSSSSSAVVVTPVDDIHTLDWEDESDDLNLEEEITEEELKKMVEQLANKETDPDLDDDDWENWE